MGCMRNLTGQDPQPNQGSDHHAETLAILSDDKCPQCHGTACRRLGEALAPLRQRDRGYDAVKGVNVRDRRCELR